MSLRNRRRFTCFDQGGKESVAIDGVGASTLRHLLVYLYTGRLADGLQPPQLLDLLVAAGMFGPLTRYAGELSYRIVYTVMR